MENTLESFIEPVVDASAVAEGPRECGEAATAAGLMLPVTHQAQISNPADWKFLACGIDGLDLGIDVRWGDDWNLVASRLEQAKIRASGTQGILGDDGEHVILPAGRPNYRWHLQWPLFHLWLASNADPIGKIPNAYCSLSSETLWKNGIVQSVSAVEGIINRLGGEVIGVKPSRCDLAVDFQIRGGLSLPFLMAARVPRDMKTEQHSTGDDLETFYQGAKDAPTRIRIYNKGVEIIANGGTKLWFQDIWKVDSVHDVWRVEFQLRRQALRHDWGVHTLDDLKERIGTIWDYLTGHWFTLRLLDNDNVTRRSTHPLWDAVRACAPLFGEMTDLKRNVSHGVADPAWYVSHCAGCLLGFAVRERLATLPLAIERLVEGMKIYWRKHDFAVQYTIRSIQAGLAGTSGALEAKDGGLEKEFGA